jgi:thioredoxin 1
MPLIDLDETNFDDLTATHEIMFLDFWADWCGPCHAFAPIYEAASQRHPEILFGKVNIDTQLTLAKQFEIMSVPTLLAAKNDEIIYARPGTIPAHTLEQLIQELKKKEITA